MRKPRWIANQETREEAKRKMFNASQAIRMFRNHDDPSNFPDLRSYLYLSHLRPEPNDTEFIVSGWEHRETISREDYNRMKAAWLETEAGKADTWGPDNW